MVSVQQSGRAVCIFLNMGGESDSQLFNWNNSWISSLDENQIIIIYKLHDHIRVHGAE